MKTPPAIQLVVLSLLLPTLLFSYDYNPHTLCNAFGDASSASFTVNGTNATMRGVIDGNLPGRVDALLANHPEVDTIILENVPGSDNDPANLQAARKIRDAGLATHVPASGLIASGGVDFFLAGAIRTIDSNYCGVEVHTWGGGGFLGSDLPRTHPAHEPYLAYYRELGINEDFYWFTLDAPRHPSTDTYNMNPTDIGFWGLEGVGGPRILPPPSSASASGNAVAKAALDNKIKKLKKKLKKAKGSGQVAKAKKFKAKIKKLTKKLRAL